MSEARLVPERESIASIRAVLEQNGFDLAHEILRPDYLISPFPNLQTFLPQLERIDPVVRVLMRLYSVGEAIEPEIVESIFGREFLESNLATGLLVFDSSGTTVSTAGLQLVSRLGQYFVVSTSRAYPGFDPAAADVYLGPESYTLANYLQRRAGSLPSSGRALDLCTGAGIAAQSLAAVRRGVVWTGVDVSHQAVEAAAFNAALNETQDRYSAIQGDLYEPVRGGRFGLIVANPPFIPVPSALDFPIYGDGGEDGLSVLGRIIAGLPEYLAPSGRAIVYAEGLGDERGPWVLDQLEAASGAGLTIGITVLSTMSVEQALFTIGRMLSVQTPSRLDELRAWQELFAGNGATRYSKFIIDARVGTPAVVLRSIGALSTGSSGTA
ncbi:MAG: methyltransferase [Thermomicrobiales bacterium]|nr:methyltransferase [Thermomicrobiales bacterium]MCO5222226.1 methyltransferase [Thermomicrobiales bacterium]